MKLLKLLTVVTCLIYQVQAGGPSFIPTIEGPLTTTGPQTTAGPPTTTDIPPCVLCADVLKYDVPPSPDNCNPGSTSKVSLTITYTADSGRSPASGACSYPNTGLTFDELGPMLRKFVASPGLGLSINGFDMTFQEYEKA
ncbi:unnamed protein product [Chironomus riparius]|uniref:Uncharacterized protein n=1 Tax=Chironomus riparius TaxID=315576 RepID=A0A9N9S7B0_9DIPT|nr:unnamed protein product [Chironomus riparius]